MDSYQRNLVHRTDVLHAREGLSSEIDHLLNNLGMTSPSILRSSNYEELIKRQLSFTEEDTTATEPSRMDAERCSDEGSGGILDAPLSEERQEGMRAVQNALEKLDSRHGVLQRPASAETVRANHNDSELLKRTMSQDHLLGPTECEVGQSNDKKPSKTKSSHNDGPTKEPSLKIALTTVRTTPVKASTSSSQSQKSEPGNKPIRAPNYTRPSTNGSVPSELDDFNGKTSSLRQLLVESKAETSDLKRQLEELLAENQRLRVNGNSSNNGLTNKNGSLNTLSVSYIHGKLTDSERRCDQLLREKENLATELWKLRQRVEEMAASGTDRMDTDNDPDKDALDSYGPDSSTSLQGTILNLESQIADLNEANETASAEVLRLDQENQMLTGHINKLKSAMATGEQVLGDNDLIQEVQQLREQLEQLRDEASRRSGDSDTEAELMQIRSEISHVKIDLKASQDKCSILVEENGQLREQIREMKRSDRWKGSGSAVNDNTAVNRNDAKEAAWDEIYALKQKIREYSSNPLITNSHQTKRYEPRTHSRTSSYDSKPRVSSTREPYSTHYKLPNTSQPIIDRAPSPTGQSDISESTTVLMAGFDAYKPRGRLLAGFNSNYPPPVRATPPVRKLEDDRMSECTIDILNEASFNSQTYGIYADVDAESFPAEMSREDVTKHEVSRGFTTRKARGGSLGSSSVHSESTQERIPLPVNYGQRSVVTSAIQTQHNNSQTQLSPPRVQLSTVGKRPFAPRSPADLSLDDIAKFTRPDGRISRGVIRFVGHIHDRNETHIGIELETTGSTIFSTQFSDGCHDGVYNDVKYFDCKPGRGVFITFNKIIMVWTS